MRAFRSHPGYDVTFTLMNPQPDLLQVQWDIKEAVDGKPKDWTLYVSLCFMPLQTPVQTYEITN